MKRLEFRARYEAERTLVSSGFLNKFKKIFGKRNAIGVKDHGVVGAQVGDYTQWLKLQIHKDIEGNFMIHTVQCMTTMNDFIADVRTSKAIDWMISKVSEKISEELEPILSEGICKATEEYLDKYTNTFLRTLPTLSEMFYNFYFDSALTSDPRIHNRPDYIETEHSAEVLYMPEPGVFPPEAPFGPQPIPHQPGGDRMIYAWGSEYIINSALYYAHNQGLFKVNVNKREFPAYSNYIQTDCGFFSVCLANLWPYLPTKFPGAHGMVEIKSIAPPKIEVSPAGIKVIAKGQLKIDLELPDRGPSQPEALLDSKFEIIGTLVPRIQGPTNVFKGSFSVEKSQFNITSLPHDGGLSRSQFEKMLGQLTGPIGSTVANSYLGTGFPIPDMVGVHLVYPEIVLNSGFFELNTDLNYTLPFDPKEFLGQAIQNPN